MSNRIGFGFDVHQLSESRDFWLGGIKIPHNKGGLGHSDADVLVHVICDALLGAANLEKKDLKFLILIQQFALRSQNYLLIFLG
jgi:2-C-methyl-D-erythritol 2,4-cyclodiphosphate synthase